MARKGTEQGRGLGREGGERGQMMTEWRTLASLTRQTDRYRRQTAREEPPLHPLLLVQQQQHKEG
jgi:hypothetical protein